MYLPLKKTNNCHLPGTPNENILHMYSKILLLVFPNYVTLKVMWLEAWTRNLEAPGSSPRPLQGSKKVPSGCPGQVDFPVGQVTFHSHLPNGQGPRQVICQLN